MGRAARLAGAIVLETEGAFYLVGNPKGPCDFPAHGFAQPGEIDARARPYIRLDPLREVVLPPPWMAFALEGEALARLLAQRFLIERNGAVSDRLWRLVSDPAGEGEGPAEVTDARWLVELPTPIWQIVREQVLRCT